MQYQIPQFIEIEDQIFGPFTFRQFIYLIGGAGASYVIYYILPIYIAIFLIIPVAALAGALAFYKVNNRPFINVVESAITYFFGGKLYLWKKNWNKEKPKETVDMEIHKKEEVGYNIPTLSQSKLKELTWSLDINDKLK